MPTVQVISLKNIPVFPKRRVHVSIEGKLHELPLRALKKWVVA